MKTKSLLVLAGIGAPLILSSAASADVSLVAVKKAIAPGDEAFVAMVVNVYAMFDGTDSATNFLTGVGGLPGGEEGNVSVRDGIFYQNPNNTSGGGNLAPPFIFIPLVPGLGVDSFLTIGAKSGGSPTVPLDATGLTPQFANVNPWGQTRLQINDGAWFLTPDDLQGHVGNADNGPNTVLIGQFSVAAGAGPTHGVFGTLRVQGVNNGQAFVSLLSFENQLPAPGALALLGSAGLLGCRRRRRR